MDVRRDFPRRGQHRHFSYLFQIAGDGMQMDVNKIINRYNIALRWGNSQEYYDN